MNRRTIAFAVALFSFSFLTIPQGSEAGRLREAGKRMLKKLSAETVYNAVKKKGGFAGTAISVKSSKSGGKDVLLYRTISGEAEMSWIHFPSGVENPKNPIEECSTVGVLSSSAFVRDGEQVYSASRYLAHTAGNPARQHLCSPQIRGPLMWLVLNGRPVLQERFLRSTPGALSGVIGRLPSLIEEAVELGYEAELRMAAADAGLESRSDAEASSERAIDVVIPTSCQKTLFDAGNLFQKICDNGESEHHDSVVGSCNQGVGLVSGYFRSVPAQITIELQTIELQRDLR